MTPELSTPPDVKFQAHVSTLDQVVACRKADAAVAEPSGVSVPRSHGTPQSQESYTPSDQKQWLKMADLKITGDKDNVVFTLTPDFSVWRNQFKNECTDLTLMRGQGRGSVRVMAEGSPPLSGSHPVT